MSASEEEGGTRALPAGASDAQGRLVLLGTVAAILGGIVLMAVLGRYGVIWKTVVIPVLLVAALASRRLGRFVEDWAVFLALVVLFDFLRGFAFAAVTRHQLPVYMNYAIDWERALLAGGLFPVQLQEWRAGLADPALLDRVLTVVHGSHFAFFLVFGLVVWFLRPDGFRRYAHSVVLVLYLGALLYLLVPTVPPWMAAESFGVVPPVQPIVAEIYNLRLPTLQKAFDVNPIAAMPSLHAALPTLCSLIAVHLFGWWGALVAGYTLVVYLASGYLGQHYLVDLLAGSALAGAAFLATGLRRPAAEALATPVHARAARPVLLAALVVMLAQGVGAVTVSWKQPLLVTREFAERELAGRTPLAHVYLGSDAFRAGDWAEARGHFERAAAELRDPATLLRAQVWLARAAFRQGDHAAVVAALEPRRPELDPASAMLLGASYLELGRSAEGEQLLRQLVERFPNEPEPVYWLARHRFLHRELSPGELRRVADDLAPHGARAEGFRRSLLALLDGGGNGS